MAHDVSPLADKIRALDQTISDLGSSKVAGILHGIVHQPGWTTPREIELVTAAIDSLQRHVDAVNAQYTELITIAGRIGKE
jgi:hypothetical protein